MKRFLSVAFVTMLSLLILVSCGFDLSSMGNGDGSNTSGGSNTGDTTGENGGTIVGGTDSDGDFGTEGSGTSSGSDGGDNGTGSDGVGGAVNGGSSDENSDSGSGSGSTSDGSNSVTYYGVVVNIGNLDNTCVFIPDLGDVSLPALEGGKAPAIEVGNLVRIFFENGKDMQMMMCYPGRFAKEAQEIEVKKTDVAIKYIDDSVYYTAPVSEELGLRVGDNVRFTKAGDEYLGGQVTALSDGKITVRLSQSTGLQGFLSELMNETLSLEKK